MMNPAQQRQIFDTQFALFVDHHIRRYEELGFGTSTNQLLRAAQSIYQIKM